MSGLLNYTNNQLVSLNPPISDIHLVNKAYVDSRTKNLDIKEPCKAASTKNINNCVYDSINKTLTSNNTEKLPTFDGVTLKKNDRVLIKDQRDKTTNGIYKVIKTNPWQLQRSSDCNTDELVTPGIFFFIKSGISYQNVGFILKNIENTNFKLDSTNLIFLQMTSRTSAAHFTNLKINKEDTKGDVSLEFQQDSKTKYEIKIDDTDNKLKINSCNNQKGLTINEQGCIYLSDNINISSNTESSVSLVNSKNNQNTWKILNDVQHNKFKIQNLNQDLLSISLNRLTKQGVCSVLGEIQTNKNTISNQILNQSNQFEDYGLKVISNKTASKNPGTTSNIYGVIIDVDDRAKNDDSAKINNHGLKVTSNSSNISGISKNIGIDVSVGGGDFNYPLITKGGNVGLGISNPKAALEIFSSETQTKISYDENSYLTIKVTDNSHTIINTGESGNLLLLPSKGNGNLGIGVLKPESTIHLAGDIQFFNGGSLKSSLNNEVLKFDSNGNIIKLGNSLPKQNNVLRWNQKVEWTEPDDINHNYLWLGDKFKIEETQDGKLKIRKRFLDKIPESIKLAGGTLDDIKEFFKLTELDLSKIRLGQWLDYMKSLPNKNNSTLNDIFGESALDYQEEKILL